MARPICRPRVSNLSPSMRAGPRTRPLQMLAVFRRGFRRCHADVCRRWSMGRPGGSGHFLPWLAMCAATPRHLRWSGCSRFPRRRQPPFFVAAPFFAASSSVLGYALAGAGLLPFLVSAEWANSPKFEDRLAPSAFLRMISIHNPNVECQCPACRLAPARLARLKHRPTSFPLAAPASGQLLKEHETEKTSPAQHRYRHGSPYSKDERGNAPAGAGAAAAATVVSEGPSHGSHEHWCSPRWTWNWRLP